MTFVPPPQAVEPPSPAHASLQKRPPFPSLDLAVRSSAPVVLLIYGVGFIILGFHDAKYGVVQFSPFRARIFLVGFVFVALVALTAAAQHYSPGYFNLFDPVVTDVEPKRQTHRTIIMDAGFILTAGLISGFLSTFIFHSVSAQLPHPSTLNLISSLALFLLGYGLFFLVAKIYLKKPLAAVFLSLLAVAMVLAALVGTTLHTPSSYLTVFLTLVGMITHGIKRWNNPVRYVLDFRNWYLALLLVWIYINWVFPGMPPRWGGGQPTPIQIFQNTPVSWSQSNPTDVLLLDETDQGFYVLLSPNGKAFFVPRSNVSSILFGPKEDLPKKP